MALLAQWSLRMNLSHGRRLRKHKIFLSLLVLQRRWMTHYMRFHLKQHNSNMNNKINYNIITYITYSMDQNPASNS